MIGLLAFSLAYQASAAPSFSTSARGTTTAQFLELGAGARAAALGQAYTAVADEASAVYWNPAALTRVQGRSATLMHAAYVDSSFFDYAAYGQSLGKAGAFGAGLQYFSAGSLDQTDPTGTDVGAFSPYDLALTASYAYMLHGFDFMSDLNGFSVGLSGKYIQSRIVGLAATGAADLGLLSPAYLDGRLRAAFTLVNLGGKMKFEQEAEPLPLALSAGSSFQITPRWLVALDARFPRDDRPNAGLGTEYKVAAAGPWSLAGRLGYNTQTVGSIDGLTGLSLGFGLGFGGASVDYAFVPMGGLGQAHRLSLTYGF
jgi:hypothetical protein